MIRHICSICLRVSLSLLTEVQYFKIEPCEKITNTNESMIRNMFFCADLLDEHSAFDGLQKIIICSFIIILNLHLNEFLQLEIKQKLSLVQKITCIIAIAYKKTISVSCVSEVLRSPPQSAVHIKQFLHHGAFFFWNPQ